jgi:hypothetical protein
MDQYRHGDVLIATTRQIPEGVYPQKGNVLARGELTGHSHRFEPSRNADLFSDGAVLYLEVREPVNLRHEEHDSIEIPPGTYRVWRQREYAPEAVRTVVD